MTTISPSTSSTVTDTLFSKLDTKQKGYIDAADLQQTGGAQVSEADNAALMAELDGDSDGKVTKSELSVAVDKLGEQLSAQLDQSRVSAASGADASTETDSKAGGAGRAGGGGGAPPASSADDDEAKYIAAADLDSNGTVTQAEAASYKKMQAKAQEQADEYKKHENDTPPAASLVAEQA